MKTDTTYNEMKRKLGLNIKHQRHLANLTQIQLAEKVSIHAQYLSDIERGRTDNSPSLFILYSIAKTLEIPFSILFQNVD